MHFRPGESRLDGEIVLLPTIFGRCVNPAISATLFATMAVYHGCITVGGELAAMTAETAEVVVQSPDSTAQELVSEEIAPRPKTVKRSLAWKTDDIIGISLFVIVILTVIYVMTHLCG